jgi:hypothetical protein
MDTVALLTYAQTSYLNGHQPQLLSTVTLGATTASVTYNVVTPYPRILVEWTAACTASGAQTLFMQYNGDTTAGHYQWQIIQGSGSSASAGISSTSATGIQIGAVSGTPTTNYWGSGFALVADAVQSAHFSTCAGSSAAFQTNTSAFSVTFGGQYAQLAPISSVTLVPNSGSFAANSTFTFYGLS